MGWKNQFYGATSAFSSIAPNKQLALTKSISATGDMIIEYAVETEDVPFEELMTMNYIDLHGLTHRPSVEDHGYQQLAPSTLLTPQDHHKKVKQVD